MKNSPRFVIEVKDKNKSIKKELTSYLDMFEMFLKQLKGCIIPFMEPKRKEHLEADIRGYEAVINSKSERNAVNFLKMKQTSIYKFKNNEVIVKSMKANGIWEN